MSRSVNVFMAVAVRLPLLLAGLALAARADLIVLQDGHEYEGLLLEATPQEIVFRRDGRDADDRYPRAEVVHIRLQERREWDAFSHADQIPDPILKVARQTAPRLPDYPGAAAVTLFQLDSIVLRTPQTWSREQRTLFAILKEDGDRVSVRELNFQKNAESVAIIHAVTLRPDGTVLHLKDTAVQEESPYPDIPRYDTRLRRRFALPEGKPGNLFDVATLQVREKPLPDEFFYEEFLFAGEDPAREISVEITAPAGCELHWQLLNDPQGQVGHTEEKTAAGVRHRWTRRDAPLLLPEPMMPPLADCVPRLVVSAFPGSWAEVAAQVETALAECDKAYASVPPAPNVRNDRFVPDALLEFVSRNVQDANIPPAATGYRPGPPAETLNIRRAPQLDRSYLLYRWLRAAGGQDVSWVWLRPRTSGRAAPEVPSLEAFTVPAIRIAGKGQPLFLLPGGDLDAVGEPMLSFVGAACLMPGQGLSRIPALSLELPGTDQTLKLDFDRAGNATVRQTIAYRGEDARKLRAWRRLTREQIRNAVEGEVHALDARATEIRYRVEGDVKRNGGALALVLDYSIPRLADRGPTLTSAQLPWLHFDAGIVGRSQRRFPLFWATPRHDSVTLDIGAPAPLALYAGADTAKLETAVAKLETVLGKAADGRTRYTLDYLRTVTEAPATDYPAFKQCLEKRASIARQFWVWKAAVP